MKKALIVFIPVLVILGFFASSVLAQNTLVRFKGGIGVIPVSRAAGTAIVTGTGTTFPEVVRNDVQNTPPGGQPWVIRNLEARVKTNGDIKVEGEGLLLAGSNGIGTNGGQSVRARLFCDNVAHNSDLVELEPNGDFKIRDTLDGLPLPAICANPVLLIVSGGGNWFAAGILED